jgi:hypothetical protein
MDQNALASFYNQPLNALYNPGTAAIRSDQDNMRAATNTLGLTPQEQALYQRHLDNLSGFGGVMNDDGSRSTLYQGVVQGPGGRFYNVPTVWDGQILPFPEALKRVSAVGWDKFPSYATPEEADARYDAMHHYMDRDTGRYLRSRGLLR